MSDSTPLFGEESKGEKVITWAVIVILVVWALFCFSVGLAFGIISNATNALLAAAMILASVSAILMFRWWRAEDLDPKFRILLLLLIANVLLIGVAINVSVWVNRCPLTASDECLQLNIPIAQRNNASVSARWPKTCFAQCPQGWGWDFSEVSDTAPLTCQKFCNSTPAVPVLRR